VNIAYFYTMGLAATAIYAVLFGGRAGRATIGIIAILFAATWAWWHLAPTRPDYRAGAFVIDCLSLFLKIGVAISSRRKWPIILAAFQLNSVGAQIAILIAPTFRTQFHYAMITVWAVPTLIVIALGIYLDRKYDHSLALAH